MCSTTTSQTSAPRSRYLFAFSRHARAPHLAFSGARLVLCVSLSGFLGSSTAAHAANLKAARITRAIGDVKLMTGGERSVRTRANTVVPPGGIIRTGAAARAEVTLESGTVVRLGANTAFAVPDATSAMPELHDGALLFEGAKRGGAKIKTGGITAVVSGTTGIVDRMGKAYVKVMALSGTVRVYLAKIGESVLVQPGQMLIMNADVKSLPEPVHFDIAQLYKTSVLTSREFAPLASEADIQRQIEKQKSDPSFVRTNLVIFGRGTLVNLVEPKAGEAPAQNASPSPSPRREP
jgi:ferric-dicitrate binding protein FerR (iron transport regulator)